MREVSVAYDGNNSIYILGGYTEKYHIISAILQFNISTKTIAHVAELPKKICAGTALWFENTVVHIGGTDKSIFKYSPSLNNVSLISELKNEAKWSASVLVNDGTGILVFGGFVDDILFFGGNSEIKTLNKTIPYKIYGQASVSVIIEGDEWVFIFGGFINNELSDKIMKYNVKTGVTHILAKKLPIAIAHFSAIYDGLFIFIFGGKSTDHDSGVIRFNPGNNEIISLNITNFPKDLHNFGAVYVEKLHRAFLFGGADKNNEFRNEILQLKF